MIAQQNKYCGVDRWHNAGITGKGVVVWNMENGKATHGKQTTKRVLHSAPDATVINASLSMASNGKEVKYANAVLDDGTVYEVEDFIKKFNINRMRLYVAGQNLFTIDNFWDGFDVETPAGTGRRYPQVKTYTIGIDIKF